MKLLCLNSKLFTNGYCLKIKKQIVGNISTTCKCFVREFIKRSNVAKI